MMDEFWDKMQGVSNIMESLEQEHKRYFSNEEELELLKYKKSFIDNCIFWANAEISDEEKRKRIRWEYHNMFTNLSNIINKNVEQWEEIDDEYNQDL